MKASIIIPSYNARERLYLNLTALNEQSYEGDDVEVIVVDNGSSDNTMEMLSGFELKYPLKTIRIEKNRGIAHGRNEGILRAEGDILIFHDSDMIASKDYIKQHLDTHKKPNIITCGLFWRRIFTHYYKRFTSEQLANFERVRKKMGIRKPSVYWDGYPLLSEDTIKNEDLWPLSFDLDFGFINDLKAIIREYGRDLSGYYLPWRFFITNNLSVERQKVIDVGMFDPNIIKYGYEDYDLGIRLYKSGGRFIMADHIVSYHQEHPANYRAEDLVVNINYMCNKYNNIYFIDVPLVCMSDSLGLDKNMLNGTARDIYKILSYTQYNDLLVLFLEALQLMRKRYFSPEETNIMAVFTRVAQKLDVYVRKAIELSKKTEVSCFMEQLSKLMKIAFDIDFGRLIEANQ